MSASSSISVNNALAMRIPFSSAPAHLPAAPFNNVPTALFSSVAQYLDYKSRLALSQTNRDFRQIKMTSLHLCLMQPTMPHNVAQIAQLIQKCQLFRLDVRKVDQDSAIAGLIAVTVAELLQAANTVVALELRNVPSVCLPKAFDSLKNLTALTIDHPPGKGVPYIRQLVEKIPQLRSLSISRSSGSFSSGAFDPLTTLQHLDELTLGFFYNDSPDELLQKFAEKHRLKKLVLYDGESPLGQKGMDALIQLPLTTLHLNSMANNSTSSLIEELSEQLQNVRVPKKHRKKSLQLRAELRARIEELKLNSDKRDARARNLLIEALPNLVDFQVCEAFLSSMPALANCKELRKLTLGQAFDLHTPEAAQVLEKLTNLEELYLDTCTPLGKEGLIALAALPRLHTLGLKNSTIAITEVNPNWRLPQLRTLFTECGTGTFRVGDIDNPEFTSRHLSQEEFEELRRRVGPTLSLNPQPKPALMLPPLSQKELEKSGCGSNGEGRAD